MKTLKFYLMCLLMFFCIMTVNSQEIKTSNSQQRKLQERKKSQLIDNWEYTITKNPNYSLNVKICGGNIKIEGKEANYWIEVWLTSNKYDGNMFGIKNGYLAYKSESIKLSINQSHKFQCNSKNTSIRTPALGNYYVAILLKCSERKTLDVELVEDYYNFENLVTLQ